MYFFAHEPENGIYRMSNKGENTRFVAFIEEDEDTGKFKLMLKDDYYWQVKIPIVKRGTYATVASALEDAQKYVDGQYD